MRFNPLEYFVGRQEEIDLFADLLASDRNPWVMLVDGLSGTGKSLLIDWLTHNCCNNIPHARLTLAPNTNTIDLINSIAEQILPKVSQDYERALERITVSEEHQSLVNYSPTLSMSATSSGTVSDGSQSVSMDISNLSDIVKEERETRRLDLLVKALEQLKNQVWVLFIDEAGYLENPDLERFFLVKLFPRLHNRFPRFRLYLTGQNVPTKFDRRERLKATLEVFPEAEASQLFQKAGIEDAKLRKSIFALSLGHPLLTGMLVEHILEYGNKNLKLDVKMLESTLDEGERTEWIYARILDNISNPLLRGITANLSLFEWFDLSLLRAVFNQEMSEKDFTELVRRSFIKTLEGGKWRCHDIILKYLRPHRINLLRDESQQIYRRVFSALQERITGQEKKDGIWNFRERINMTSAALSAMLEVSLFEAHDYLLAEIAQGFFNDPDYLYPLIRFVESRSVPEAIREEVKQVKRYLEDMNLEQYSVDFAVYLDYLGQRLFQQGNASLASDLEQLAAILFSAFDQDKQAIASARRASEYEDNLENRAVTARVLTQAGQFEAVRDLLTKAEQQFGDQTVFQIERSRLAFAQGESEAGMQILFETIARHPQDVEAHEVLMEIMIDDGQYEAALSQAEAILEIEPGNSKALLTRIEALSQMGRIDEVFSLVRESDLPFATMVDNIAPVIGMLNDPFTRGRLLAELEVDPESVPPSVANIMTTYFGSRGDVKLTDMLAKSVEAVWPEIVPITQTSRALARLVAGQVAEAQTIAETLLKRGEARVDTYIIMAKCYGLQGKTDEAIGMLEEMIQRFPFSRDMANSEIAQAYLANQQPEEALAYLDQAAEHHVLEPYAMSALADVYITLGRQNDSIQVLEELIYTAQRSELPIQQQLAVRVKYASLLAQSGDKEKASDIAYELLNLDIDPTLTTPQAARVFILLEDEAGLRAAFRASDHWDTNDRATFLSLLSNIILKRNASVEGLLAELAAYPDRLEIVLALDLYITQNNLLDRAPEIFQRVEEIAPGMTASYIQVQQDALGQAGPAQVQQLEAAIALQPENITLRLALARYLLAQGLFEKAKQAFDEAVRLNPGLGDIALHLQAAAFLDAGELEMARGLLEPYLAMQLPPLAAFDAVQEYLVAIGDRQAEIKLYESAAQAYPHLRQPAIEKVAEYEIAEGRDEHALELIDQVRATEELEPGLARMRVIALRDLKRYDEALAGSDEILSKRNLTPLLQSIFLNQQAETYVAAGQLGEAFNVALKAVELDKNNPDLHFSLADVCLKKEEWNMAYEAILDGLALAPARLPEYQETLRELVEKRG